MVADLGVARSVVDSSAGAMVVGTPSYMAPEQAGGGAVDHRADVYALCAVAYALLAGGPPFPVLTVADLTSRPADVGPPPLAERLGAPATLDGLFLSGLATDPHRRPPSAALLADAFDQLADELIGLPRRAGETSGALPRQQRLETAPVVPVQAPEPPATPTAGRSSAFYIAMTVLAILLFAAFLGIVIAVSLCRSGDAGRSGALLAGDGPVPDLVDPLLQLVGAGHRRRRSTAGGCAARRG